MTLRKETFTAVRWTTVAAGARATLQMMQTAILARILAPEQYGLMAMVNVVLNFAILFADLGMNSAYVQKQDVSDDQRCSLFWLNTLMGFTVTLLVFAFAPILSSYFGDVRLVPLLKLSSVSFAISALGQQVRMTAEKRLNFKPIALIEIAAGVAGFIVAVWTARLDWEVYSLVFGAIVTASTITLLSWLVLSDGWFPRLRFRIEDIRPYVGFGGAIVGYGIVGQFYMGADMLLGGRLLSASQLGLYSLPRNLVLYIQFLINPIVTRVGFPLIAQVQEDTNRVRSIYLRTLTMTTSVNAPLYIGTAFFSKQIVYILFGGNWIESAVLLKILAIWGLIRSTMNPVSSLLFGIGRAELALRWISLLSVVVLPLLWMGSHFGAQGLSWALLVFALGISVPAWHFLVYPLCRAGLAEYGWTLLKPILIAAASVTIGFVATLKVDAPVLRLFLAMVITVPVYVLISFKFNRVWCQSMLELFNRHKVE